MRRSTRSKQAPNRYIEQVENEAAKERADRLLKSRQNQANPILDTESTPEYAYARVFATTGISHAHAVRIDPDPRTPRTYKEAIEGPDSVHWKEATKEEVQDLIRNHTWKLVKRKSDIHVISGRWVFKIKRNTDGDIARFKARWVARGFK